MLAVTSLTFCCTWPGGPCSTSISTLPLPLNLATSVASLELVAPAVGHDRGEPVGAQRRARPAASGVALGGPGTASTDGVAGVPQALRSPQPTTASKRGMASSDHSAGPQCGSGAALAQSSVAPPQDAAARCRDRATAAQSSGGPADRRPSRSRRDGSARAAARRATRCDNVYLRSELRLLGTRRAVVVRLRRQRAACRGARRRADRALPPRPGRRAPARRGHARHHATAPDGRSARRPCWRCTRASSRDAARARSTTRSR